MSGPHTYRLIYFDARARGELTRLLFAHAGVEYEDCRLKLEEWTTYKQETPFGKLPLMVVDGKYTFAQSKTIARFVAIETGLAGRSHIDRAKANMYVELVHDDLYSRMQAIGDIEDEDKKAEEIKKFQEGYMSDFCKKLEKHLKFNGGKFLVGKQLTWADIAVADGLDYAEAMNVGVPLDPYPLLTALKESVFAHPGIAVHVETRQDTEF